MSDQSRPEHAGGTRSADADPVRPVLLAEAEKSTMSAYQRPLEQAGYPVIAVPSADAAAISKTIHPALIILQLVNPVVSGLALVRELRTQDETRGTPLITLMPFDDAHTREQIVRAGATAILIDPVKPLMLLRQMRRLLSRALADSRGDAGAGKVPAAPLSSEVSRA